MVLCLAVAILAGAAATVGVFFRGGGSVETVVSPRGERYQMVVSGVYRYNAQRVVAEGIGWDIFTLFAAVPALLLCLIWLSRIFAALNGKIDGILLGQTTPVVQALDLGLVVPLAIFTGVTALRRRRIGYLLCSVVVIKGVAMAAAVALWLALRIYRSVQA